MNKKKIAIIGAGSAGLFTAYLLSKSEKAEIEIFEEDNKAGLPKSTLIVTDEFSKILPEAKEAIINKLDKIFLLYKNKTATIVPRNKELVIDRTKLDNWFLKRLKGKKNVRINYNHQFLTAKKSERKENWQLIFKYKGKRKTKEAEIIIGADGTFSNVAKLIKRQEIKKAKIIQARVRFEKKINSSQYVVWFNPVTKFFFWLIPENSNIAAIGLNDYDIKKAKEKLNKFLKNLGVKFKILEYQETIAPLFQPNLSCCKNEVYLVGDALAHMKNTTLGGIVPGLRASKALANSLIKNKSYKKELRQLNRELWFHYKIQNAIEKFSEKDFNFAFNLMQNKKIQKMLSQYNRDSFAKLGFRAFFIEPRLLYFLRFLL